MIRFLSLILFITLLSPVSSFAGIHVEPYLGYGSGKAEVGSSDSTFTGTVIGAKLGYGMLGLSAGLDIAKSTMTADGSGSSKNFNMTDMGIFVSYEFPILLKASATYFFDSKSELDGSPKINFKGNGTKLGVGYTLLPLVALNLDYTSYNITDVEYNGVTASASAKASMWMFSVSVPLDL